jgi:hypothetical protein
VEGHVTPAGRGTVGALLTRPCTLHRTTSGETVDEYGNAVEIVEDVAVLCELQPRSRKEPDAQGELSQTDWLLILPAGTEVSTADTVTVDGETFEMVGDSGPWRNPRTGVASHVEASVRKAG